MILGLESITRRRPDGAGSRGSDGRFVGDDTTDATIRGSIQPASDDEIATLPEGDRQKRARRIYTSAELVAADQRTGTEGDLLIFDSASWEVRAVARERSLLAHYRVLVVELQEEA